MERKKKKNGGGCLRLNIKTKLDTATDMPKGSLQSNAEILNQMAETRQYAGYLLQKHITGGSPMTYYVEQNV